jgi:hypothetical protein
MKIIIKHSLRQKTKFLANCGLCNIHGWTDLIIIVPIKILGSVTTAVLKNSNGWRLLT